MFEFINAINPLIFNIIVLILSLLIVIKAADLLIFGISNYSRKFGISEFLVGFLVLAIGTSLPDLVASLMGGMAGSSGIIVGTILGGSVISITLVLGVMVIAAKKLNVKSRLLGKSTYIILIMLLLPMITMLDAKISRVDGVLLILVFFAYIFGLWKKEGTLGKIKKSVKIKFLWKDVAIFLGALVALLLGAKFLVSSAVIISQEIGISAYIIALIIICLGTCLPDLTVELKALKKGHAAIGVGNLLGGITSTLLLVLGIVAVIYPISLEGINTTSIAIAIGVFLASLALVIFWMRKNTLHRWQGIILVMIYLAFVAAQIVLEII
jgi:cation:H+ antiporter